jgi:hypothetical protein
MNEWARESTPDDRAADGVVAESTPDDRAADGVVAESTLDGRAADGVAADRGPWARLAGPRQGLRLSRALLGSTAQARLLLGGELLLVVLWALLVTRPYQNMDPTVVPVGNEYLSAIQTHHLWTHASTCGWCALWNGDVGGGAPAFADPYGSMLHPLVILTTLGWGVLNGSKLALIGAFIMGGLAQWWLGHVLGLSRVARIWSACLAVTAGHLSGRIAQGTFGLVLSTAACMLVLPPLLMLCRTGSRRAAVLLGVTLGLALLAGQGYMQIGLALVLPAAYILLPRERRRLLLVLRRFGLAIVLALLLAGPLLVPFFHFLPEFQKDNDPAFASGQPFTMVPLNLVIDDPAFYKTEALHKLLFPYLYINFVGWFAVLLALWALRAARTEQLRNVAFLFAAALLALWLASGTPLVWLARFAALLPLLGELVGGIRYYPVIAGLAVPPILGLAGIGLDHLWDAPWAQLRLTVATREGAPMPAVLDLRWLLVLLMLMALQTAMVFRSNWLAATQVVSKEPELETLRTADLQWVNPPFGEHPYIEPAARMGLKLSYGFRTWRWRDRPPPEPVLVLEIDRIPPNMTPRKPVADAFLYQAGPGREYAAVTLASGERSVCSAQGVGGQLAVSCNSPQAGVLVVKENRWSGWRAWVDGRPAGLLPGQWLSVELPAGSHTIELSYYPWDVPIGLLLCLIGVVLAIYLWRGSISLQAPLTQS